MKKLPIGIQTFKNLIEDGCYYVDKTPFIKRLVDEGKVYFLSRPRRFGKSLFLSTLKEAFQGSRDLFKGLFLYSNWDWDNVYPVIHISFGSGVFSTPEKLETSIDEILKDNEKIYSIPLTYQSPNGRFKQLIEGLYEKYKAKVVVLVDEYDKPILDVIENKDVARANREILKNFYTVLKDADPYIKFVFLTGVSKFSKVSIFSGLNQLNDITLDQKYATVCGYTEEDLYTVFADRIGEFDINQLREWYNGYSWLGQKVYNPFDVLLLFDKKDFRPYWFETGTPAFLIKLIIENNYCISKFEDVQITDKILESFDIDTIQIENLLFQTGYLTIQERYKEFDENIYRLTYPNREVKVSFNSHFLGTTLYNHNTEELRISFRKFLIQKEFEKVKNVIQSLFASLPHIWVSKISSYEGFYVSVMYALLSSSGFKMIPEDMTNTGRIDCSILYNDIIYILEFKVVDEAKKGIALQQIKEKKYYEKYLHQYSEVYLIGIEFSKINKNITGFEVEKIK